MAHLGIQNSPRLQNLHVWRTKLHATKRSVNMQSERGLEKARERQSATLALALATAGFIRLLVVVVGVVVVACFLQVSFG